LTVVNIRILLAVDAAFAKLLIRSGAQDIDTESTDVTRTGVAYRRLIPAKEIVNNTALQCSMQFDQAVQPTASLPVLTDSPVPPTYSYAWSSPTIRIIGKHLPSFTVDARAPANSCGLSTATCPVRRDGLNSKQLRYPSHSDPGQTVYSPW